MTSNRSTTNNFFPNGDPDSSSLDVIFDALSVRRCRYALRSLEASETPISLDELAEEVAVREHETAIDDVPSEAVKRVYASLYHSHVPKLADADLVDYDWEHETVALSGNGEWMSRHLDRLVE